MATTIGNQITLDGQFTDWLATDAVMTSQNTVAGYQVYGAFLNDATLGNTYVIGIDATATTDAAIAAGTVIYLNADQNNTTGYSPFGKVGAEYEVQFALDSTGALQPYLYSVTSAGVATLLNGGAPLDAGFSSNGESVELAIPQALLTPAGGVAPTSINFATLINGAQGLPGDFTNNPEYTITDPAVLPTTIGNLIALDGTFSDWPAADIVTNPANVAAGYQIYGAFLNDATLGNTYVIGIDATAATDPVIGLLDTIYLNTDQNAATGYNLSFANVGAEYEVQFAYGSNAALEPFLYSVTSAGVTALLNGGAPLDYGFSSNGESLEVAIPQALLTPVGGAAPTSINFVALNGAQGLPTDLAVNPQYTITDTATLAVQAPTHKVAIVYSDTTAALYFSQTAYSDLFMAAQNQARMAGVSYDIIDESQLTNINNLIGYDAIIFPSMADVNTAELPAIMSTLISAVYNYHIGIITAGDFLTNDQTGAPLPGNPYSNMETLLGLARVSGGNSGAISVTANDVTNPIMKSYTAGQVIQTYPSEGYADYQAVGGTATDVLVNQTVTDPTLGGTGTETIPGVIQTTTGGTNVEFASQDLLGDSNLLSNAIQAVSLGTQPGVALHEFRDAGIVAVRMDMDQSQFPADVTPAGGGPGIYDTLIPILQQWNQQYDFVGSYFVNIGDNPNGADPSTTNWTVNSVYYKELLAMGSEIGNHSYTHLINPPTTGFTATTSGDTPAGSTTITLTGAPPSFAGVTVGMFVTASNGALGTNTPLPGAAGEGGSIANSQVTAVSGDTITISYVPGGYGAANDGTIADIPAGTTLTFSIPAENTNFLQTTGTVTSATGNPFTYAYEFQQSAALESQELGIPIEGAAIPGANETFATDQNILPYYQSVAATATTPGYTGFLTGGWTGVGSGYPSAIGYMSPSATDEGSLYIAPNMTFDFTEIQYEGKTVAQAEADWAAQFNALTANAAGTPVVVLPVHDYGVAAWNTTTDTGTGSPYTTAMYTQFIAQAYADNYEFLTLEELAARTEAQQKAAINYTTVGNTITATVTPDPTAPDVGGMALDVINGGTDVIQNVTNWYAYNTQELFLPTHGGTFTINLGTTQDAVTHIESLPMRGDLLSVTGNGRDLSFAMDGTGQVVIDLDTATSAPIVTGATVVSDIGNVLTLSLASAGENDVAVYIAPAEFVRTVSFSADTGSSASDFITNIAAQTISGTLSSALLAGDVVKVSLDGGTTWQTATAAAGATTFSLAGVTLLGSGTLKVQVENSYGMASTALVQAYVLDQTPPAAPTTPDLTAASDSGVSSTDNVTNVTTPTFTGTAEAGSTVTLFDGVTAVGTAVATASGSWSITTPALASGVQNFTAEATDVAGNVSAMSGALPVTIDASDPVVTGVTAQPSDAVLGRDAQVTLSLGLSEPVTVDTAGGIPTLSLDNGRIATYESGSGTSSLTFGYTVGVGEHVSDLTVTAANLNGATVTDVAGNPVNLSGAVANPSGTLDVEGFAVFDVTKGQSIPAIGEAYKGPVAGLQNEYINVTSDNLNVSAFTPNWFIHTGSGTDAIAVSSGTNVLDGGTGSNFLTGGSGTDTFFVDDRGPTADIWSTVNGFHAGDAATIWGVTPQDFNLTWVAGQGAAGYTGLTLHATAAGQPTASLTLAGYTMADLSDGRLSVQFGTDPASGSAYMYVHGNS